MGAKRERGRGAAVVYDAEAHREFVTGFRKRKQKRREQAAAKAKEAEKEARRDERKARREVFRGKVEEVEEEEVEEGMERQFEGEGGIVTAVVAPLESAMDRVAPLRREKVREGGEDEKDGGNEGGSTGGGSEGGSNVKVKTGRVGKRKWRKVSYTHLMSNRNKRKAVLKRRREGKTA